MNKNKKIFIVFQIVFVSLMILIFLSRTVFAFDPDWNIGNKYSAEETGNAIYQIGGAVVNILTIIAATVGVVMLIMLGIQYMFASAEGRAEVKKTLPIFLIGAAISFSALAILKVIQTFIEDNINNV